MRQVSRRKTIRHHSPTGRSCFATYLSKIRIETVYLCYVLCVTCHENARPFFYMTHDTLNMTQNGCGSHGHRRTARMTIGTLMTAPRRLGIHMAAVGGSQRLIAMASMPMSPR